MVNFSQGDRTWDSTKMDKLDTNGIVDFQLKKERRRGERSTEKFVATLPCFPLPFCCGLKLRPHRVENLLQKSTPVLFKANFPSPFFLKTLYNSHLKKHHGLVTVNVVYFSLHYWYRSKTTNTKLHTNIHTHPHAHTIPLRH